MILFRIKSYINYLFKATNAHGLHSPFMFDFYNEVIGAKKEFYLFKRLRILYHTTQSRYTLQQLFFLFRWVNFYKIKSVEIEHHEFLAVLTLGFPSLSKVVHITGGQTAFSKEQYSILSELGMVFQPISNADFLLIDKLDQLKERQIKDYKCIIISNPYRNKEKAKLWLRLTKLKDVTISIDVFQFGILLVDKNQAKQHFVVKF